MTNAERLRRLRVKAVAAGRCQECRARPAKPECKTCQVCLDKRQDRVDTNVANDRCVCGREPQQGRTTCTQCSKRRRANRIALTVARVQAGSCPRCGEAVVVGKRCCQRHLRMQANEQNRARRKAIAAGKCGTCRTAALFSKTFCYECLVSTRDARRARDERKAA